MAERESVDMRLTARLAILMLVTLMATAVFAEEFVDPSATFSLEIAKGWTSQETHYLLALSGPTGIAQMNISKQATDGATLAAFAKVFASEMKKVLTKFKVVSYTKTTVSGVPAGLWVYTAQIDGIALQFKNYVIFPKDTAVMYNVVMATIPKRYTTDVAAFDTMVKSWTWSKS